MTVARNGCAQGSGCGARSMQAQRSCVGRGAQGADQAPAHCNALCAGLFLGRSVNAAPRQHYA